MTGQEIAGGQPLQNPAVEPASPSIPTYSFLHLTCRLVQVLGAITALLGIIATILALDKGWDMLPTFSAIAFLINGVCVVGLAEAGLALRDMAINSFRK